MKILNICSCCFVLRAPIDELLLSSSAFAYVLLNFTFTLFIFSNPNVVVLTIKDLMRYYYLCVSKELLGYREKQREKTKTNFGIIYFFS